MVFNVLFVCWNLLFYNKSLPVSSCIISKNCIDIHFMRGLWRLFHLIHSPHDRAMAWLPFPNFFFVFQIDPRMWKEGDGCWTDLRPEQSFHFNHLPKHQQIPLPGACSRFLFRAVCWDPAGSRGSGWKCLD